jgi:hypothetical protein
MDAGAADSGTPGVGPFTHLDKRFVCSDILPASQSGNTLRLTGLTAGTAYSFTVVAIDAFGNPTPSPVVQATPQAPAATMPDVATGCSCALVGRSSGYGATLLTMGLVGLALMRSRSRRSSRTREG